MPDYWWNNLTSISSSAFSCKPDIFSAGLRLLFLPSSFQSYRRSECPLPLTSAKLDSESPISHFSKVFCNPENLFALTSTYLRAPIYNGFLQPCSIKYLPAMQPPFSLYVAIML